MAEVDAAVGIGQGAGNQNTAGHDGGWISCGGG
jgi:hypothetical protein